MCNNSCYECSRKVYSTAIAVVTVDTVATLVISVPQQSFNNCQRGCIVLTQNIPDAATINMPVAIAIGDDTTTVYPIVDKCCNQITPCALRTRCRYPFIVSTNAVGGTFKILKNLSCAPNNNLTSIPATPVTGG